VKFQAILIDKLGGSYTAKLTQLEDVDLPQGDVTVGIAYSALNYKDCLAITGKGPVVRKFPMVPGVDLAGIVEASAHPKFRTGDEVILTGWGVGELHWGGLAERARVNGDWLVRKPDGLSHKRAMALGTAGLTAMLSVMTLERLKVTPDLGEILVTGASGGVGGVAIQILHRLGYRVAAATGRVSEADYLHALGADEIIDRKAFSAPDKPLGKERWAGAIDSAGGQTLANVCATMRYGGVVAACGMADSLQFPASVAPFILRSVTLAGIESVYQPNATRELAWSRLAQTLDISKLDLMTNEAPLENAIGAAQDLLAGRVRGRMVIALGKS
jgi:acrylyl-CoA reductase (NADPH)